jgi:hypothetical protein
MTEAIMSAPGFIWLVALITIIAGGLVLYALHKKGDVDAEFSHGATSIKLRAKDRRPKIQDRQKR